MKNRWTKRRKLAVDFLGSQCVECGDTEVEFDHIDPDTKIMSIAKASSRSEKFFWAEVKKCQLLCRPCHIEKTKTNNEYRKGL